MNEKERLDIIKQRVNTIRLNTKIGSRRIADEENAVLLDHIEYNLNKLCELIERDTPMQVNSYAGSIFREYKCQCGQHFNSFYHLVEINFCPKCGQRIDWSQNYKEAVEKQEKVEGEMK